MPPRHPAASEFNTSEFRLSDGPAEHNAATAWASGHTGQGVTIAVVDTGVDANSPEFRGRLSPLSKDILGADRDISGSDDHGTHVALIAAAARNGSGVLGIAYDATILALRTDAIGSCAAESPVDAGLDCSFIDSSIAAAIDYASANGAKVINISLGGQGATAEVRSAAALAVNRGSLIVLSAGNGGAASPDTFATLLDTAGNGGVIIVGSVDADGAISEFSNRAGTQNSHYITARGEELCCSYEDGRLFIDDRGFVYRISGTSFSAPQVSGAAALLAQAFPNLTGRQIADILLRSAFDVGAPGVDAVFGHGILDIARAFQPLGTTSLAGSTAAMPLGDVTGAGSAPMGDALASASLPAIVLDAYGRAFQTDLAGTLRTAAPPDRLRRAIGMSQRRVGFGSELTSLAFSIDDRGRLGELRLDGRQVVAAPVLAARVATQLTPNLKVGFAYAESARGLVGQLQGQSGPAFMIAPDADGDDGAIQRSEASLALRGQRSGWGVTVSAEHGAIVSAAAIRRQAALAGRRLEENAATYGLAFDRRFGAFETAVGLAWMAEENTLLGARFHEAFGLRGANTLFLDARAGWVMARRWRLDASFRQGRTSAREAGLVAPESNLTSRAWSFDLDRSGVFSAYDNLGLRLSQPLRVESGALNLRLPTDYSYQTLLTEHGTRAVTLAPRGRELMGELAWRGPLLSGEGAVSVFYRRDPGHHDDLPDDAGLALRWNARF